MKGKLLKDDHRIVAVIVAAMLMTVFFSIPNTPENFFTPEKKLSPIKQSQPLNIPEFSDQTMSSGIFFAHMQGGERLAGLDESLGAGACAFDYDNDGWLDLFLIGGSGQTHHFGHKQWWQKKRGNRLFRNTGNAKFEDVTTQAGVESTDQTGMGCVHADLDNDGDQELLLTTLENNILYRNNGDGTFKDITAESGIHGNAWSTSAAIADYDGDGLLDVYITNYIKFDKRARTLETDAGFTPSPPLFDATLFDAEANQLYRNMDGLKFNEQARNAGVDDQGGRGLSALWIDANSDGLPDLVVGNDEKTPSRLFLNDGDGTFTPAGDQFGINNNSGFQSIISADINGDGNSDIIAGTPSGQLLKILLKHEHSFSDNAPGIGFSDTQHAAYSTWGAGAYDFNLDGTLDLMAFNGLRHPDSDAPRISVGQQKNLWLNSNRGLVDVTRSSTVLSDNISARGAAFGDFDNDGDVDAVIIHNNNPVQLLINQISNQNWLGIQLQGVLGNRDAIGATVKLTTPSGFQSRDVTTSSGFLSDHDRRLQFGLGHDENVVSLHVRWADGTESNYKNLSANRYYLLKQGEDNAVELIAKPATTKSTPQLQLTFGKKNTEFRMKYLQWLVESGRRDVALETIELFIRDSIPSVRMRAIEQLQKLPFNMLALPLLTIGMDDAYAEVRLATVQTLKQYEDESTIYWLLRTLHDEDESVRIASAQTFEHFFREEEAMVNGKWLAIPHLVSLLNDPSSKVKAAAARALGETESYRGVEPLIQLVSDKDEHVKIEALRSLGLLREIRALPTLQGIANAPENSPLLRAHAFIALKRLNSPEAKQIIEAELSTTIRSLTSSQAVLIAFLLTDEDGGVFEQKIFFEKLLNWLKRQNINSNSESLFTVITALEGISGKEVADVLLPFTDSIYKEIRISAYQTLLYASGTSSLSLVNKALSDSLPEIQNFALEAANRHGLKPSSASLLKLINHDVTAKNSSLLLVNQQTPELENKLVILASDQNKSPEVRLAALSALIGSRTNLTKNALKNTMLDTNAKLEIRKKALHVLATASPGNADLIKLTHLRHDPLSKEALSILAAQNNKHALTLLWRMLNNVNEKEDERVFAATTLFSLYPQKTIDLLQGIQQ